MYDQSNMGKVDFSFSFSFSFLLCVWLWGIRERFFQSLNIGIYILQNDIRERKGGKYFFSFDVLS